MKRIIGWATAAGLVLLAGAPAQAKEIKAAQQYGLSSLPLMIMSALPFQHQQKRDQRVHKVLSSYDVLSGPATNTAVYATKRFKGANPKAYQAFVTGLQKAIEQINKDKRAAAASYQRMTGTKESVDDIYAMIAAPEVEMTFRTRR